MTIGLLSDTHDNLPKIKKAVQYFKRRHVAFVLHAGDFVAPFTLAILDKLPCGWAGVFGNNDGEKRGLAEKSSSKIKSGPLRIKLGEKKITLVHDLKILDIAKEKADLIVFGHSHKPEISRSSGKILVNPGECGGWLYGQASIALVDLDSLKAQIVKI